MRLSPSRSVCSNCFCFLRFSFSALCCERVLGSGTEDGSGAETERLADIGSVPRPPDNGDDNNGSVAKPLNNNGFTI